MTTNINNTEMERYELEKDLCKAYPKLTKESLSIMVDTMLKLKDNKNDLEYLIHALTQELNDLD